MKQVIKMAPLALAVAAIGFSGVVAANPPPNGHPEGGATITKKVWVEKHVKYHGEVKVGGYIGVNSLGMAVIDDKQQSIDNGSYNTYGDNTATLDGNALENAKGNIGVNISAGDNNVQGNSAALAASDAEWLTGGSADAEIFLEQRSGWNTTDYTGAVNKATFNGNALQGAMGNIGVNIAAGSNNVQKNALALAVAGGVMGESTIRVRQEAKNNGTTSKASGYDYRPKYTRHYNNAHLGGNALKGAMGNIGVNIAAGSGNVQNNSLAVSNLNAQPVYTP